MKVNLEALSQRESLIVGVMYQGQFAWYVSSTVDWYLQLVDVSFADFLFGLREEHVQTSVLRDTFASYVDDIDRRSLHYLCPSLWVDFDNHELVSVFPEPHAFEHEVPDEWRGEFDADFWEGSTNRFLHRFPDGEQYWIVNGRDLGYLFIAE